MLSRWLRHRPHWALQRDGIPQPPAVDTRFDAAPWRRVQQPARLPTCMNPLNTAQAIIASGGLLESMGGGKGTEPTAGDGDGHGSEGLGDNE